MLGVRQLRSHPSFTTTVMKDVSQPSPSPPATNGTEPLRGEINRVSHSNSPSSPALPTEVENGAAVAQNSAEAATTTVPRRERDSSWLELETCREHLRQTCPRQADECRYAHPDPGIYVKEGRVTCCYDFLKDRCFREKCRYFHPPLHIKERLVSAGKQFGAMMSNLYVVQGNMGPTNPHLGASLPLMGPIIYSPDGRVMSAAPPSLVPNTPYGMGAERMDVCPYFAQGKCINPACHMIHPEPHVRLNLDATITVCRDFVRGGCWREKCRYFHPSVGILAQSEHSAVPAMVQQRCDCNHKLRFIPSLTMRAR
ncbi:Muscleblind-like protein 3 [Geodia barretti]|uniref:Muscleblind-like protein 3 n=1 Tax=Geodia barretti TaxID=519541 RepID=A0AA35QX71_GEOBA|nr:Muscleblind-like protein 3 [Geodia barretti]